MNSKLRYYYPTENELFIGYECERKPSCASDECFVPYEINQGDFCDEGGFFSDLENGLIRTKFLSKEDFQKLGFTFSKFKNSECQFGHIHIDFLNKNENIRIFELNMYEDEVDLFIGKCPSINELKIILKLINK